MDEKAAIRKGTDRLLSASDLSDIVQCLGQYSQDSNSAPRKPNSSLMMRTLQNEALATTKLNSVALVRTRTIPTERKPPVGEVSANFCG